MVNNAVIGQKDATSANQAMEALQKFLTDKEGRYNRVHIFKVTKQGKDWVIKAERSS